MKSYLIAFFLLFQLFVVAQDNSDFLSGFDLITQSDAAEPFFQIDADESNSMILLLANSPNIGSNNRSRSLINLLRDMKAENRNDFSRPIQIMTPQEMGDQGIDPVNATMIYFYRVVDDKMNIILTTTKINNGEQYTADFRFLKKFNDWEIIGEDVRSSRH